MKFRKYQHIERFETSEVENIEMGKCYVFPKIDGTNASIWLDDKGIIQAGSRKRHLELSSDNGGFLAWVNKQMNIRNLLQLSEDITLFGEWLIPHSLKTYKDDAWRRFYVFDIMDKDGNYIPYDDYKSQLDDFGIDYISPISIIDNGTKEQFINQLQKNVFLVEDGKGIGEGIVIKNYDFINKYGRQMWAKIVTSEFKEKHSKSMGAPEIKGKKMIELTIAKKYVTKALCEKVKAKISIENDGFRSKDIPRLLMSVYYDVVKEESWNYVKEHKNPTINFKKLQVFVFAEIKNHLVI